MPTNEPCNKLMTDKPPTTISKMAQRIFAEASVFDLGKPHTPEQWQALREHIASEFDAMALMQSSLSFELGNIRLADCPVLLFKPPKGEKRPDNRHQAILHFHGGCHVVGSARADSVVTAPLCLATHCTVYSVDYPLAPEQPYPAALDQGLLAYQALLEKHPPEDIAITGSSSGASLATAIVLRAMENGLPAPVALGLLSPWADLSEVGDSYQTLANADPMITYELTLAHAAKVYACEHSTKLPTISPVYASYPSGFPPTLIQTGTRDLFLSNCVRLHRQMRRGGVAAQLSAWEGMWHSFQMIPGLPEGEEAVAELAAFIRQHLD